MKPNRSKLRHLSSPVPSKQARRAVRPLAIRKHYLPFGQPNFGERETAAVAKVLRSGWVGMGKETLAFEEELAAFLEVSHVVTVNSCTSALFLALLVEGVKPGDEVICPSFTWCSTANAALYLGATPVFCDIDPATLTVTPESVHEKITAKTKAVMVVHFGGLPVDVKAIRQVIPADVTIIEDAAHAFGSHFDNGRLVGASGNLTCFSFYANKNLSTGEGGAIALFDGDQADRVRSLRQHGLPLDAWKRFTNPHTILRNDLTDLGYKMNYTDLQAAIGRVQLARYHELAETRDQVARCYVDYLSDLVPPVTWQEGALDPGHARHLFVVQLPLEELNRSRDEVLLELRARNIGAAIHYPPLHLMPLYCRGDEPRALPNTEVVGRSVLTLPISSSMTLQDAEYVAKHLTTILNQGWRK
jgi:perosamine synthetase